MASKKQLEKRIKSVKNIAKITKAMEMVAASKMRQAQAQALASRVYSRKLDDILSKIAQVINTDYHPLLSSKDKATREALLIISTDKGLTGSLNTNLFKAITQFQDEHQADVFTIGRLAKEFTLKAGFELVAQFGNVGQEVTYETTQPVADLLMKRFLGGEYKDVWVAYMDFETTLSQKPRIIKLLPIKKQVDGDQPSVKTGPGAKDYTFEPDASTLLDSLLPYSVELTIYQSMLEARASEHSARMVSMKNASDNASELGTNLNLQYNRSRQADITNELSDMVTAMSSMQ